MRRTLSIALVALSLFAARAEALTFKDIIDLTRAGLGDEVLLALIEVDGSLFTIDPESLKGLKAAGVSDRVIEAIVRSGRTPQAAPAPRPVYEPEPPTPQLIVVEHERPVVQEVAVPVPVYVPVRVGTHLRGHSRLIATYPVDPSPGFGASAPPRYTPGPAKPVYWGWGGKLRPDAWKPTPAPHRAERQTQELGAAPGSRR